MTTAETVEAVFRSESGRIIATLIRLARSFDRAEEAMQDALAAALEFWPRDGTPQNPAAWITATAQRKLIDRARRDRTRADKEPALRYENRGIAMPEEPFDQEPLEPLPDDRLRLIFTCCHPALNRDAQVGLTLRTLGGLTTREIARAFLTAERTVAQRLVRAQRKIQEAGIPYEVPAPHTVGDRLIAVEAVIYLIFNEGYTAASGAALMREDLCREAIRLARVLADLMPDQLEVLGLLALMLLHDSRRLARVADGRLATLEDQDRTLWDRQAIEEGQRILASARAGDTIGPYVLQAEIARLHAVAPSSEETDFQAIAALYERLADMTGSPVVALNQAAALTMSGRLAEALSRIDALGMSGDLADYHLFHAARADVLRRLQRFDEAAASYRRALAGTSNEIERGFLESRLREIGHRP